MRGEDEQAFTQFVADRGPHLVRLARGLLKDPHQAEDVVQDVLSRAFLRWDRIQAVDDPDAYVRKMVVNACTSWFRRAARREFAHDAATLPEGQIPDPAAAVEERDQVLTLLRQLPAKQRAVLILRHYEGLPDEEISHLLGSSQVTVRSNAHRGLAALRGVLTGDTPGQPMAKRRR